MAPGDLLVEVQPPAYTGRPSSHLRNPSALEVIAASRVVVTLSRVPANADPRVRINGFDIPVRRNADTRIADAELTESGYLAVDGEGVTRRLILTVVVPDHAPEVRIVAPARDLHVADASGCDQTLPARRRRTMWRLPRWRSVSTRISGAGEQYEFHEGTLTTALDRWSGTHWRASARLALAAMKLEPGDALVYRAVAHDRRPGDQGLGTSDAYFVEIAGPGDVALTGFDMPPDRERYVLSQQMIVLKIQRLRARESSMTKAAVQEAGGDCVGTARRSRQFPVSARRRHRGRGEGSGVLDGHPRRTIRESRAAGDSHRDAADDARGSGAGRGIDVRGAAAGARGGSGTAARLRTQQIPPARPADARAH